MKPILILQHLSGDGPATLGHWLAQQGLPFEVRNSEAGEVFPERLDGYGALAILGGEMSANDPLPSLRRAEQLWRQALEHGVPTLGHCLGGQLMARALGAKVRASPQPEIGWQPLQVLDSPRARAWFGDAGPRHWFQWHYEAFDLPDGAEPLATSDACPWQAFALGPHLAMQFHIELDDDKLQRWSREDGSRWQDVQHQPTVQSGPAMREQAARYLPAQVAAAQRLYAHWWSQACQAAAR